MKRLIVTTQDNKGRLFSFSSMVNGSDIKQEAVLLKTLHAPNHELFCYSYDILEPEAENLYILYGADACKAIKHGGIDELLEGIKDGSYLDEYRLEQYKSNVNPLVILEHFKNWNEYLELGKKEYDKIKKAEDES